MYLISFAISCLFIAFWAHRRRYWRNTYNVPRLSGELPGLGIAHQLYGDNKHIWGVLKKLSMETNNNGGVSAAWLGPTVFCFVLTDPEISLKLSNTCLDKPYLYNWAKSFVGEGLITSSGNVWKTHRKLLNPAFNQNVLNGFFEIFNQRSRELVKTFSSFADGKEFNPRTFVAKSTLETICQTAMGLPNDKMDIIDETYLHAMDRMLQLYVQRISNLWIHPQSIYNVTSMKRKEDTFIKILQNVSINVLRKSKESILNGKSISPEGDWFKPLIKHLLEMSDDGRLSDNEIREEVDTMIAAGYETTANTLVMALIMIGSIAEIQEKVMKELEDTFGDMDRDVTKEDLSKLVYLEAVIKECLRYYPVVPVIGRRTDKDVIIDNITFPAGCIIFISIWGIHRHMCWGKNRNEFVPDRWLSPDTLPSTQNAFAAFSMGKRTCIGKIYTMMSVKVTLAHILRKYRVKADHTKLEFTLDVALRAVAGNQICLEPR